MIVERGDDLFGGIVPTWVVMKERSCWGFYLFERFVELCREPTRWTVEMAKDFVVVMGGEFKIVFDMMSGGCVDVTVVHTEMRMRVGEQG